ncbi:TetR/AcrR family transcriptional regulator [Amycolatopsis orientalis]|uniref:TetR/AcrR family transcriptional regulator n=1 Tax=Amycolatopsis orientalis TaxID=31958 RepID=UPI002285CFCA|nr:TetR/AcrR family transcriptional regulator [Amycolatopsis orientalis]
MRRTDAAHNRVRILATARMAFVARGSGVPMREIARQAEVSVATVYRHFPAKDALIAEAFAEELALCSSIVEEGLAAADPWHGFVLVLEKLTEVPAREQGFRAFVAQLPRKLDFAADRARTLRMLLELIRRAQETGELRPDFVLEDLVLALVANEGIRVEPAAARVAAVRRFTALLIQSFRARPDAEPLPPAVRVPFRRG